MKGYELTYEQNEYLKFFNENLEKLKLVDDNSKFWDKYSIIEKSINQMRDELKKGDFEDIILSIQEKLDDLGKSRATFDFFLFQDLKSYMTNTN